MKDFGTIARENGTTREHVAELAHTAYCVTRNHEVLRELPGHAGNYVEMVTATIWKVTDRYGRVVGHGDTREKAIVDAIGKE